MATNQPQWKMVANLGDVNPIDHDGFFVYVDRTGVYPPEVEVLQANGDDDAAGWTIYRAIVERNPIAEWWYVHLHAVAATIGQTLDELQIALQSDDPIDRARVYQDLIGYFGGHEFDSYPRTYAKRSQLPRRVRRMRNGI